MTERAKKLLLLYYKQSRKIRRVSGLPPLTFKAKKAGTLKNYRIYGQTVDGESVGDRTGNLFDMSTIVEGKYISSSGIEVTSTAQYQENILNHTDFINVSNDTAYSLTCVMPYSIALDNIIAFCWFDDNESLISRDTKRINDTNLSGYSFSAISPLNATYLIINFIGYVDETTYMLNEGSTPLPYEPYGYKVPVTVSNGTDPQTTTIYLDTPLAKSGNNADYIDYATQKRHNLDGTESNVTLPAISTLAGTNTLTVGTEVQPSSVEIKGRIKAAGGD